MLLALAAFVPGAERSKILLDSLFGLPIAVESFEFELLPLRYLCKTDIAFCTVSFSRESKLDFISTSSRFLVSKTLQAAYSFHLLKATDVFLISCAFKHHKHAIVPARIFESTKSCQNFLSFCFKKDISFEACT